MSGTDTRKDKTAPNHPTPSFGNPDLPPQGALNTAATRRACAATAHATRSSKGSSPRSWILLLPMSARSPSSGLLSIFHRNGYRMAAGRAS